MFSPQTASFWSSTFYRGPGGWPEATNPATGRSEPTRLGERHGLAAWSRSRVSVPGRSLLTRSGTFYSPLCAAIRALCHRPYPPGPTSDAPSIVRRRVFCWSDGALAASGKQTLNRSPRGNLTVEFTILSYHLILTLLVAALPGLYIGDMSN